MPIIKLSKNERRRASVFITCLGLAMAAWVFNNLANPHTYGIKLVINFTNGPLHRSFRSLQSDTVDAQVQGSGWSILFSTMNKANPNISVNLKTLENRSYIVLSSQLKAINEKRSVDKQIISINPDTLYFDFSPRATKRVTVQLNYKLKFVPQFGICNTVNIRPDYVMVTGPEAEIAKITVWKTDSLKLNDVQGPIVQYVHLQNVKESNMSIYPKAVQAQIPVDEFTEKTVEIPVKLINNRNFYNVKIFPQKVKVTFTVSLGKYAETNDTFFEAVADLDQWHEKGREELPVKLTRIPDFCKIVTVTPQNLDFIVVK